MSTPDRTWPECLDVPEHIDQRLRAAADDLFERACDRGGKWDEKIRQEALDAASMVLVFDIFSLQPAQIATLAGCAFQLDLEALLNELPIEDPNIVLARLGICHELMELRAAALARVAEIEGRDAP